MTWAVKIKGVLFYKVRVYLLTTARIGQPFCHMCTNVTPCTQIGVGLDAGAVNYACAPYPSLLVRSLCVSIGMCYCAEGVEVAVSEKHPNTLRETSKHIKLFIVCTSVLLFYDEQLSVFGCFSETATSTLHLTLCA